MVGCAVVMARLPVLVLAGSGMGLVTLPREMIAAARHGRMRVHTQREPSTTRKRRARRLQEAVGDGVGRGGRPGARPVELKLFVDVGDVPLDCTDAEDERLGDLVVA